MTSKQRWIVELRGALGALYLIRYVGGLAGWTRHSLFATGFPSREAADEFVAAHVAGDVDVFNDPDGGSR